MTTLSNGRVSPILSTLNTSWDDISPTQQRYYLRKTKEVIQTAISVVSPGQEKELWNSIRKESLFDEHDDLPMRKHFGTAGEVIDTLIEAHNQAESWQTKRQILSLFANDFSRAELQMLVPGLSKWRIDQARQHAITTGRGQPPEDKVIHRTRIEPAKVDHFIDYISRPQFLQDVAFGTKTLRLDSGQRIIIPAVIRKLIPSRLIDQYTQHCREQGFEPASERSLYRMMEVCSASMHAEVSSRTRQLDGGRCRSF